MNAIYAFAYYHGNLTGLISVILPLCLIIAAACVEQYSMRGCLTMVGVAVLLMGLGVFAVNRSNPYIQANDVSKSKMGKLADIRRRYPSMDPLIRVAAADRRITNAEYDELTEGRAAVKAMEADEAKQDVLNHQAVIDGIPPVSPQTSEKRK